MKRNKTIYVISKDGKPLMPTNQVTARLLLKSGKAKCIRSSIFTIKMIEETSEQTQPLTLGIDTGSSMIGSAVVDDKGNVAYVSEVEVRNDITNKMTQRVKYRRNRRNRKTRYRKARWEHRKNSIKSDRFSPTMISKFDSHLKEVEFVKSILPTTKIIVETGTFDPHALKNPDVLKYKWLYQKGLNYGFANTKAFVLNRDNYICRYCKNKKNKHLEVHHIVYRSNGGSDEHENLVTLCKGCHDGVHNGTIKLKGGKKKGTLNHATQMNSIRVQLLKVLKCEETFGFVTKLHRERLNLPKEHYIDAIMIASQGKEIKFGVIRLIKKKCISDGDYQQTKGVRSEQRIPTGKIKGYRKFDKVEYEGKEYFIMGRMSIGYAILMNIKGEKQVLKPIPKFDKMKRISSRKSWITQVETIPKVA